MKPKCLCVVGVVMLAFCNAITPAVSGVGGFVYDGTSYKIINVPFASVAGTTAINDLNQIVGVYSSSGSVHGFLFGSGGYTTLDEPLATNGTFPYGINNLGQIVGQYGNSGIHGFLYSGGSYTTLDDPYATNGTYSYGINDTGQIVGYYQSGIKVHGFVYSGGTYTTLDDPLATNGTIAKSINNNGQIVGFYNDGGGSHGFLYSGGSYTTLNDPLATAGTFPSGTYPSGINDAGQIVGNYWDPGAHGFLYSRGIYTTLNYPSNAHSITTATFLYGINDLGKIVGYSVQAVVPEPSIWVMMLLGFAVAAFTAHYQKKGSTRPPDARTPSRNRHSIGYPAF